MDNRYNIGQLFQVAFGTNLPVYLGVPIGKQPKTEVNYGSVQVVVVTIFQKFRNFAMSYNKEYEVIYHKMENAQKGGKRLKGVAKVFVKFDLILIVK